MREMSTVRTNILLTPSEHRHWTETAKARGVSLAEYIRRSVAAAEDAPTAHELDDLEALSLELTAAAERMHRTVDEALQQLRASRSWEADVRDAIVADLARDPVVLDPAILDFAPAA